MRELSNNEVKKRLLEILKEFDNFCNEKNINYSLGEGTLIGAVRHKGFIPWDDDVDIIMLRKDYERFVNEYHSNDNYSVVSLKTHKNYHGLIARLVDNTTTAKFYKPYDKANYHHGLWIDICPIDNAPKDLKALYKMVRKARFLFNLEALREFYPGKSKLRSFAKKMIILPLKLFPPNFFVKKAERVITKYDGQNTKKRGFFPCIWHDPYIFSSSVFDSFVDAEFEGETFKIAKGYDEYLRAQYGDYMQLPPEDQQVAGWHGYSIFVNE